MCHKFDRCHCNDLVVPLVCPSELQDDPASNEITYLGQLRVHNSNDSCIHMSEARGRHLCPEDGPCEQASAAYEILPEQLRYEVLDVCDINLVDKAVNAFS